MNTLDRIKEAAKDCKVEWREFDDPFGLHSTEFNCFNRSRLCAFRGIAEQIMQSFRDTSKSMYINGNVVKINEVTK